MHKNVQQKECEWNLLTFLYIFTIFPCYVIQLLNVFHWKWEIILQKKILTF